MVLNLSRIYTNLPGWRTKRKILVIESDDWGSIRMPSPKVYRECLEAGYPVDRTAFERYDSIASEEDLTLLFDLLLSYRDHRGRPPVITANCVVANPDFEKIGQDGFARYHYELITETFKKYPQHQGNFGLWQKGMESGVFRLQYHAREHLNVSMFMEALQQGDRDALFAFGHQMPGIIPRGAEMTGNRYVGAMQYRSPADKEDKLRIYLDGLDRFEELFGYRSATIIPPNYLWSPDFEEPVHEKGVEVIQGLRKFFDPDGPGKGTHHPVHLGKTNRSGQRYSVRNVIFEPTQFQTGISDPMGRCLSEMALAFTMRKPAIVASHRINFVGFLDPENRDRTLKMMDGLLSTALKRWPDLEFMSSDELGALIHN